MKSDGKWFVRNKAGKVFGPIDFETLQLWVRDGRVEPLAGISEDLQNWMLAPLKPELEMNWIVENNPGQFYGPTHRDVVDDFIESGTLSPGARFYCDDRGKTLKALEDLGAELEQVRREKSAEEDKALKTVNDFKEELDRTRSELDRAKSELDRTKSELDRVKSEQEQTRSELDKAKSELERVQMEKTAESDKAIKALEDLKAVKEELEVLKAEKEAVHAREWKTEVLVPEVVVSDEPPPSMARTAFGVAVKSNDSKPSPFGVNQSSLEALERQAQAELARMGAAGAKKLFGLGRKK